VRRRNCFISLRATIGDGCVFDNHSAVHGISKLHHCRLGRFSYLTNSEVYNATIGSFCSIGSGTIIGGLAPHPMHFISTSPAFYSVRGQLPHTFAERSGFNDDCDQVSIGSDVWIGAKVIILPGVSIGHGAVIGAGSVVTSSVPPYSICVGTPAKLLRLRFSPREISTLLECEWWTWPSDFLESNRGVFTSGKVGDLLGLEKLISRS
jgi:acetyltransferase-like isoleucine patch superfamily enzyme